MKNSARINDQDLRSLRAFKYDYPEAQAMFLYRGKERLLKKGVHCIPCEAFLKKLNLGEIAVGF